MSHVVLLMHESDYHIQELFCGDNSIYDTFKGSESSSLHVKYMKQTLDSFLVSFIINFHIPLLFT